MIPQELIQTSSPSMTSVSSSVNPSGIVVPAGGLQQGNVAMTTINSQVVSGKLTAVAAKKKNKNNLNWSLYFGRLRIVKPVELWKNEKDEKFNRVEFLVWNVAFKTLFFNSICCIFEDHVTVPLIILCNIVIKIHNPYLTVHNCNFKHLCGNEPLPRIHLM